jgi:hypothetical protein
MKQTDVGVLYIASDPWILEGKQKTMSTYIKVGERQSGDKG